MTEEAKEYPVQTYEQVRGMLLSMRESSPTESDFIDAVAALILSMQCDRRTMWNWIQELEGKK